VPSESEPGRAVLFTGLKGDTFDFRRRSMSFPINSFWLGPSDHLLAVYAAKCALQRGSGKYALLGLAAAHPRVFWTLVDEWLELDGDARALSAADLLAPRAIHRARGWLTMAWPHEFDAKWLLLSMAAWHIDDTDQRLTEGVEAGLLQSTSRSAWRERYSLHLPLFSLLFADQNSLAFAVVKFAMQRFADKSYEEFSAAHLALLMEAHAGILLCFCLCSYKDSFYLCLCATVACRFTAKDVTKDRSSLAAHMKGIYDIEELYNHDERFTSMGGTSLLDPVSHCFGDETSLPTIERSSARLRTFNNDLWNDDWQIDEINALMPQPKTGELQPGDVVFTTFATNVGFDYCALFKTTDGDAHLLLVECKSGDDRSLIKPNDLKQKMVNLKLKLAVALAPGSAHPFARAGIQSSKQVTLLLHVSGDQGQYAICGHIEAEAKQEPTFEGRVVTMSKRQVAQFLGPMFDVLKSA
jgi:hypothetical protein